MPTSDTVAASPTVVRGNSPGSLKIVQVLDPLAWGGSDATDGVLEITQVPDRHEIDNEERQEPDPVGDCLPDQPLTFGCSPLA